MAVIYENIVKISHKGPFETASFKITGAGMVKGGK